ncbi:MAG: YdcF family protein [Candidatus Pacebacteria bacterium]|nr:YdcF family protein [Candidatus Paceibacterota bacterium]
MFQWLIGCWEIPDNLPTGKTTIIAGMMLPQAKNGACSKILDSILLCCKLWYFKGVASRVVFTNRFVVKGKNLAEVAKSQLVYHGVPSDAITISKNPWNPRIRNTFEEVHFAIRLLRFSGAEGEKSVLIVANHIHMRRALAAYRRLAPPETKLYWVSVNDPGAYGFDAAQHRYILPIFFLVYEWAAYTYSKIRGFA